MWEKDQDYALLHVLVIKAYIKFCAQDARKSQGIVLYILYVYYSARRNSYKFRYTCRHKCTSNIVLFIFLFL